MGRGRKGGGAQQCAQCGCVAEGRVDPGDRNFYCAACWASYVRDGQPRTVADGRKARLSAEALARGAKDSPDATPGPLLCQTVPATFCWKRPTYEENVAKAQAAVTEALRVVAACTAGVEALRDDVRQIDAFLRSWSADRAMPPVSADRMGVLTSLHEASLSVLAMQRRVRTCEALVDERAAELRRPGADPVRAREDLRDAEAALDRAEARLDRAKQDLRDAKQDLDRVKQDLRDAEAALDRAEARLDRAKQDLDRAKQDLRDAETALDRVKQDLDRVKQDLREAKATLALANAELKQAMTELHAFDDSLLDVPTTVITASDNCDPNDIIVNGVAQRCCFCDTDKGITRAHIYADHIARLVGGGDVMTFIPLCGTKHDRSSCHALYDRNHVVVLSLDTDEAASGPDGWFVSNWVALMVLPGDSHKIRVFQLRTPKRMSRTAMHRRSKTHCRRQPSTAFAQLLEQYARSHGDRKADDIEAWMRATQTPEVSREFGEVSRELRVSA